MADDRHGIRLDLDTERVRPALPAIAGTKQNSGKVCTTKKKTGMRLHGHDIDHGRFLKITGLYLLVVCTGMLSGYFAWTDGDTFNMLFKLVSRLLMTISVFFVYRGITGRGAVGSFGWQNELSPLLYYAYLALGLLSFLWSTDIGYSALQWFMDIESLVFCYYFIGCFLLLDHYFSGHSIRLYKVLGHAIFLLISIF